MAIGRLLHRGFHPGHSPEAGLERAPLQLRRIPKRHIILMVLALLAGALASFSLALDPPDRVPPGTSYLPQDPLP